MASVVGIGAAVFDILMTVDAFPREDTKLRGLETKFQCGGPCATGLVAISKLGESASYMGTVGDDMYGSTDKRLSHQALHCCFVRFTHPVTEQIMEFTAPMPDDMNKLT